MNGRRFPPPWLWAPAVLVTDFVSKRLVLAHQDALSPPLRVVGEWARFSYVRNYGAAMGLFHGGRPWLVGVSIGTSALLAWLYLRSDPAQRARRAALAAILGGALGNLVDRLCYAGGGVVDFIDLGIGPHRFYTFNVADMGVTLGGAALFLAMLAEGRAERRAHRLAAAQAALAATEPPAAPAPEAAAADVPPEPAPEDHD